MRVLARLTGERAAGRRAGDAGGAARARAGGGAAPARRRLQPGDDGAGRARSARRAARAASVCPLAAGCRARARGAGGVVAAQAAARRAARSCASSAPASRTARACWWSKRPGGAARRHVGAARGGGSGRARAPRRCARRLAEATGVRVAGVARTAGAVRHVFTHRDVTAELFRVEVDASGPAARRDRRWVAPGGARRARRVELRAQDRGARPSDDRTSIGRSSKCREPSR